MNKRELKKFRETYSDWDKPCITEGIRLAVHFDEKDTIKRIGARWQPDASGKGGYWWLPCKEINNAMPDGYVEIINIFDDHTLVQPSGELTRLEWLNINKMVFGLHGTVNKQAAVDAIGTTKPVEHHIRNPHDDEYVHFYVFAHQGVINWAPNGENPNMFRNLMTIEAGQDFWKAMMDTGYRPVLEESVRNAAFRT